MEEGVYWWGVGYNKIKMKRTILRAYLSLLRLNSASLTIPYDPWPRCLREGSGLGRRVN